MIRNLRSFIPLTIAFLLTPLIVLSLQISAAQVMTSSNYKIQSDSVNVGGGLSSSTNYSLESSTGEVGTGQSNSASYSLRAGYQQMQEVFIALSGASVVSLSPSIPGVTGGIGNGSTTVTVTTDSLSGYELTIQAEGNPAMQKGADTIADYAPVGANPDFSFITGVSDAQLGYSPEGVDVVQRFLDNGTACNTGLSNAALSCWDGLSITPERIASGNASNHPAGETTTINFRVGVGGAVVQAPGEYVATTTITALPL